MRARRRGFTLLEVLIALAIVATLAVLGYRALAAMSESETRLAAEAERWRTLDLFFARLEGDLRQAIPRAARLDQVREAPWLAGASDAEGNAALAFSRAGPEFNVEPGSAGQRLQYRFREGAIEVVYWPGYDRVRAMVPTVYALLNGVSRFRLAYLTKSGAWVENWPVSGESELPQAARVELVLANGESIQRWLALR
ncbi:MAG: type II secretion system minor pseudopilin GspJ [Betaproteobacteria bacterium]